MQNVQTMTPDQLRETIRTLATGFAAEHYRKAFRRSTEVDAWAWADRNWQQFEARAIDTLALIAAEQAASEAAPRN